MNLCASVGRSVHDTPLAARVEVCWFPPNEREGALREVLPGGGGLRFAGLTPAGPVSAQGMPAALARSISWRHNTVIHWMRLCF